MLTKRLIACFDIINGMVTKAMKFQDNIEVGSAERMAKHLYEEDIDELIFYDITASSEKRNIDIETVKKVAGQVFIPFTVGGGIKDVSGMYEALKAAIISSMLYSPRMENNYTVSELKEYLLQNSIHMRPM